MDIISWQGSKLILPKDLIELSITSLNKTAMLSRVSLKEDITLSVLGFYLQNQADIVPDNSFFPNTIYAQTFNTQLCCYHLSHGFYIFLAPSEVANNVYQSFQEKEQLLGSLTWHTLRLAYGQIDIYPESRGLFLPHRLDLHQTQYLSFNKGCYKGQEIIARMHYKATLKHQMRLYAIKTDQRIFSGQKLFKVSDSTELGELIDFSLLSNEHFLIAVSILKGAEQIALFEGHHTPIELTEYSIKS
jgi:folate-binding protein YgfZ